MKNNELLDMYLNGATEGKASNLKIHDKKLIQYETVIAYRMYSGLYCLNGQYYSPTTSRVQNYLKTKLDSMIPCIYVIFDTEEDLYEHIRIEEDKEVF